LGAEIEGELHRSGPRLPPFASGRPSVAAALELAQRLHSGRADGDLSRGTQVATLMHQAAYEEDVVAAGLLQAVVREDLEELAEVEAACGHEVGDLVASLVDSQRPASYERRKAEQRERIIRSDRVVAAIYAADQLTRIRAYAAAGRLPSRVEFRHYQRSARALEATFPGLPFVAEMRFELGGLTGFRSGAEPGR
jgi:(p)ppGpp synthase/HD superfamily hydrolase